MAMVLDNVLPTELDADLALPWDALPDVDLDQLLNEATQSPEEWPSGWPSSPPDDVSVDMTIEGEVAVLLQESISCDVTEPPSPSVGMIEMELRTLAGQCEVTTLETEGVELIDTLIDSGMDGDTDDSLSDHSSDTGESNGSSPAPRLSRLPQLPKVEPAAHGSPSPPPLARSTHPRPRSGEALVAGITDRERELLMSKHGVSVPTQLPLTKQEDRKLRGALRKIRNKASAQRSRRNKETYIRGLESRVNECTRINVDLGNKVNKLQEDNRSLLQQLNDLRRQVAKQAGNTGAGLTLMMAVFCFSLQTTQNGLSSNVGRERGPITFQSRTLLSVEPVEVDDMAFSTAARAFVAAILFTVILVTYFAPKRFVLPPPLSWIWTPSRGRFECFN